MIYATLGTVSHGTMRTEDLLDTFASALEDLVQRNAAEWKKNGTWLNYYRTLVSYLNLTYDAREVDPDNEEAVELVVTLTDALNEFAPPYAYFGAHEGDGSDYGFWLPCDVVMNMRDDGVLIVSDLSEAPEGKHCEIAIVNDHGNLSYGYVDDDGEFHEVWSVV